MQWGGGGKRGAIKGSCAVCGRGWGWGYFFVSRSSLLQEGFFWGGGVEMGFVF